MSGRTEVLPRSDGDLKGRSGSEPVGVLSTSTLSIGVVSAPEGAMGASSREELLLEELRKAVRSSEHTVREIEVGTELSIALGRRRPSVSCGGCSTPLAFEDIPARTVVGLRQPFRLVTETSERSPTPGGGLPPA